MLGLAINITEQKQAEEQIIEYQKRLKTLATELTITEEKQRKQIAADLHDHVGQLLASTKMQVETLNEEMDKTDILLKTKNVSQGILQAIKATRSAIFDLSPPQLNELGLFAATSDWLEEQIEMKYGIRTQLTGDDEIFPLEDNVRLLLFRSIREILINVVKHAKATEVKVDIKRNNDFLTTTIKDNGIGFNYSPELWRMKSHGFGLFSIQERMGDLGGSMYINSTKEKGTEIKLIIPLKENL